MKRSILAATLGGLLAIGGVATAYAEAGFDNPSADNPPHIVKFSVNVYDVNGPGCGLQWDGTGTTATVTHGDPSKPGNNGCIAGIKIDNLAASYPTGRAAWDVWVGEPRSDITNFGHGPFKGWAMIVGTGSDVPTSYDFALDNTAHDGSIIYLSYAAA